MTQLMTAEEVLAEKPIAPVGGRNLRLMTPEEVLSEKPTAPVAPSNVRLMTPDEFMNEGQAAPPAPQIPAERTVERQKPDSPIVEAPRPMEDLWKLEPLATATLPPNPMGAEPIPVTKETQWAPEKMVGLNTAAEMPPPVPPPAPNYGLGRRLMAPMPTHEPGQLYTVPPEKPVREQLLPSVSASVTSSVIDLGKSGLNLLEMVTKGRTAREAYPALIQWADAQQADLDAGNQAKDLLDLVNNPRLIATGAARQAIPLALLVWSGGTIGAAKTAVGFGAMGGADAYSAGLEEGMPEAKARTYGIVVGGIDTLVLSGKLGSLFNRDTGRAIAKGMAPAVESALARTGILTVRDILPAAAIVAKKETIKGAVREAFVWSALSVLQSAGEKIARGDLENVMDGAGVNAFFGVLTGGLMGWFMGAGPNRKVAEENVKRLIETSREGAFARAEEKVVGGMKKQSWAEGWVKNQPTGRRGGLEGERPGEKITAPGELPVPAERKAAEQVQPTELAPKVEAPAPPSAGPVVGHEGGILPITGAPTAEEGAKTADWLQKALTSPGGREVSRGLPSEVPGAPGPAQGLKGRLEKILAPPVAEGAKGKEPWEMTVDDMSSEPFGDKLVLNDSRRWKGELYAKDGKYIGNIWQQQDGGYIVVRQVQSTMNVPVGDAALPIRFGPNDVVKFNTLRVSASQEVSQYRMRRPEEYTKSQPSVSSWVNGKWQRADAALAKMEGKAGEPALTEPTTTTLADVPITNVPVSEIVLSTEVKNFKQGARPDTGVVPGEQLGGTFQRFPSRPITIWERLDGTKEVITGRHRLDLARRTGEKTIPAQIVKESEGFTKDKALKLDAEANILDAKGTVGDYARYFKNTQISAEATERGGILTSSKARDGWDIGRNASPDLYARFQSGDITQEKAVAIARAAPGNERIQGVAALKADSMSADALATHTRILRHLEEQGGPLTGTKTGLLGFDESAQQQSEAVARTVGAELKTISEQLRVIDQPMKHPQTAAKMGIDLKDPASILKKKAELEQRKYDLQHVETNPELYKEMMTRAGRKEMPLFTQEPAPAPSPAPDLAGAKAKEPGGEVVQKPTTLSEKARAARAEAGKAIEDLGDLLRGRSGMAQMFDPEIIKGLAVAVRKLVKAGGYTVAEAMQSAYRSLAGKLSKDDTDKIMAEVSKVYEREGKLPLPPADSAKLEGAPRDTTQLAERALAGALAKDMGVDELGLSTYEVQTRKKWWDDALALDPAQAERIAAGLEQAPQGIKIATVFRVVERRAIAARDMELFNRLLAAPVGEILAKHGQEIAAAGEADPLSPVAALQRIEAAGLEAAKRRGVSEKKLTELQTAFDAKSRELFDAQAKLEAMTKAPAAEPAKAKVSREPGAKREVSKNRYFTEERKNAALAELQSTTWDITTLPAKALKTFVEVGGYYIERGLRTFAAWSKDFIAAMPDHLREKVKPHLEDIFAASKKELAAAERPAAISKVKTGLEKGKSLAAMSKAAREIYRSYAREGMTGREARLDAVWKDLKEIDPSITREQARDALSGYGQSFRPSQEVIEVELRDEMAQHRELAKQRDMTEGKAPLATGPQRDKPSQATREEIKKTYEAKKQGGYDITDPATQLQTAQGAIKTRLTNEIADLDKQIAAGKRTVRDKTGIKYTPELERLREQRDAKRTILDEIDPQGKPNRDAQRIKAIEASIADYERRIAEKDIAPRARVGAPATPELEALRQRRDILRDELQAMRDAANPKMTPEERAERYYAKRYAALETKLASGDYEAPAKRPTLAETLEANGVRTKIGTLKKEVAQLSRTLQRLRGTEPTPADRAELVDLAAEVMQAQRQMEAGERRTESGDGTRAEIAYGEAEVNFTNKVNELLQRASRMTWGEFKARPAQVLWGGVKHALGASKALVAAWDNSFIGRQGLKVLFTGDMVDIITAPFRGLGLVKGHEGPRWVWSKTFVRSFKTMWDTIGPDRATDSLKALIVSWPDYNLARQCKIDFWTVEEAFPVHLKLLGKVPVIGHLYRATENAFNGSAWYERYELARRFFSIARKIGVDLTDKVQQESIGKVINSLTGRGKIGKHGGTPGIVNNVMFSVRNFMGNVDILTAHLRDVNLSSFARKRALMNLIEIVGGMGAVLGIAKALGAEVEWDPNSADFGQCRIGNTRFNLTGGLGPYIVAGSRMIRGKFKSSTTGEVRELNTGKFGGRTLYDVLDDFLSNKASPIASEVIQHLKGQERNAPWGQKPSYPRSLVKAYTPLIVKTGIELKQTPGAAPWTLSMLADSLGISTSTYVPNPTEDSTTIHLGGSSTKAPSIKAPSTKAPSMKAPKR